MSSNIKASLYLQVRKETLSPLASKLELQEMKKQFLSSSS